MPWEEIAKQGPVIATLVLLGGAIVKYLIAEKKNLIARLDTLQKTTDDLRDARAADQIAGMQAMSESAHLMRESITQHDRTIKAVLKTLGASA